MSLKPIVLIWEITPKVAEIQTVINQSQGDERKFHLKEISI